MKYSLAKSLTKVAVTYNPPTFKFEYTKGTSALKFHKKVDVTSLIEENAVVSNENHVAECSQGITDVLIERYSELLQIAPAKIKCLIQRLLSESLQRKTCIGESESQINMKINTGAALSVSPLRKNPKLQRHIRNHNSQCDDVKDSDTQMDVEVTKRISRFGNLNGASDQDLAIAKHEMNEVFEKQQVLPSHDEYMYDKRIDFEEPDEESSWD